MANNPEHLRNLKGQAKSAFNRVNTSPPKQIEKPVGRNSEMVKNEKPGMNGPKPPGGASQPIIRQEHERRIAADDKAVRNLEKSAETSKIQRPVIQSEHLKEGMRLRERFKKAAEKDHDKGR